MTEEINLKTTGYVTALEEIGLTRNESKIYISMIKLGVASALEISKESQVTYGRIYEILRSLEKKLLISTVPGKTKKFVPTNPDRLYSLISEKENTILNLKEQIKNFKTIYSIKKEPLVEVVEGRNKFLKFLQTRKSSKTQYTIKHDATYDPTIVRKFLEGQKKGNINYTLTPIREDNIQDIKKWLKIDKNIREIKNNGFAMSITDEEIFFVLTDSFTIINITDKNMIEVMKQLFMNTYNSSKEIKVN